jgi:hypothetical protein
LRGPRAESAHYDAGLDWMIVRMTTGIEIGFAPRDVEGLQHASTDDLKAVEVEAFGLGIHFPTIDADLYVPAVLEEVLGRTRWMAARLGRRAGVPAVSPRPRLHARMASGADGRARSPLAGKIRLKGVGT